MDLVGPRIGWRGVGGRSPRLSQRGSERRCSSVVSGGAARSRLELSHAPTSTSIHLPASASDRFLVWTLRPGRLPTLLPALNSINNAAGSRLAALDPCQFVSRAAARSRSRSALLSARSFGLYDRGNRGQEFP